MNTVARPVSRVARAPGVGPPAVVNDKRSHLAAAVMARRPVLGVIGPEQRELEVTQQAMCQSILAHKTPSYYSGYL